MDRQVGAAVADNVQLVQLLQIMYSWYSFVQLEQQCIGGVCIGGMHNAILMNRISKYTTRLLYNILLRCMSNCVAF